MKQSNKTQFLASVETKIPQNPKNPLLFESYLGQKSLLKKSQNCLKSSKKLRFYIFEPKNLAKVQFLVS